MVPGIFSLPIFLQILSDFFPLHLLDAPSRDTLVNFDS